MHGLDQPLILGLWGMYSKAAEGLNATARFRKYLPANGAVEGAHDLSLARPVYGNVCRNGGTPRGFLTREEKRGSAGSDRDV